MTAAERVQHAVLLGLGTTGYTGLIPGAPGTVSTAAVALLVGLWRPGLLPLALLTAAVCLVSVPVSTFMEHRYGEDPGACTIDEAVGYLLPLALHGRSLDLPQAWPLLGLAFVLFRVLDVVKPWPANRFERLPRGWGIVMDDAMAGIYTWVGLEIACALFPQHFGPIAPWLRALVS